jgi:hypothetical protein
MPKLPIQPQLKLPRNEAMKVAKLAQVPARECERFCDDICWRVERVWERDRRAVSSKPGRALLKAAKAARVLNEAIWSLNKEDREWVKRITARDPEYQELIRGLLLTVSQIDDVFSIAVGKFIPRMPGTVVLRNKRGRIKGGVGDAMFGEFIQQILFFTARAGGEITFDKNYKKGTLIDILNILRPRLPEGVVPNALHYGTIQKIKTKFSKDLRHFLSL